GWTPPATFVTCRTLPPSGSATYTCMSPPRFEMNAIRFPSGDQRGEFSVLSPPTSSVDAPDPSDGTTQMSALRFPVATSVVVVTYATIFPSGDSWGSETGTAASRSFSVIGRAANAGAAGASVARAATTARFSRMPPLSHAGPDVTPGLKARLHRCRPDLQGRV